MLNVFRSLFFKRQAVFVSPLTTSEAISRLRAATSGTFLASVVHEKVAGKVTEAKVVLRRDIPFVGNSFKPYFIGRFEQERGETILRGAFKVHLLVRAFMAYWFGFCILWTAIATFALFAKPTELWFFPLAGVGMLLAGTGFVWLGQWFARNDEAVISSVIKAAVGAA